MAKIIRQITAAGTGSHDVFHGWMHSYVETVVIIVTVSSIIMIADYHTVLVATVGYYYGFTISELELER